MVSRRIISGVFLFFVFVSQGFSSEDFTGNSLTANRFTSSEPINIDGKLDESVWQDVNEQNAMSFYQRTPVNGKQSDYKTSVKIIYDDFAIYVAAKLFDPNPSEIPVEVGERDNRGLNSDYFGVFFDTYAKGQNAFGFQVTSANVQADVYYTQSGDDTNWDAVWTSEIVTTDDGWQVEMRIPYSALRFPDTEIQNWNINFMRRIRKTNEESYWNFVDNSVSGFVNQFGELKGLRDIKPPVRLQLYPFLGYVGVLESNGTYTNQLSYGMDLKYGLSESFTLDMSLIPDFSQVQSDNVVLNLSPFEVKYAENRPFFTEGIELFDKNGLFYSRRIGQASGEIAGSYSEEDSISNYPGDPALINSLKVSGRTKGGLGIGFLNAVTNKTEMTVTDLETGESKSVTVDPFTNFNVMVIDQNLKNNSNISFINTSVLRGEGGSDANVTGTELRLRDKSNRYEVYGFGALSNVWGKSENGERDLSQGFAYRLSFNKISGNWRYGATRHVESDDYDINDLGFLSAPNDFNHSAFLGYEKFENFGVFNRAEAYVSASYNMLYDPRVFTRASINTSLWAQTKGFWSFGWNASYRPVDENDYFEPRVEGRYFNKPENFNTGINISSDGRKRVSFWMNAGIWTLPERNQFDNWFSISPNFRVSNTFSLNYDFSILKVRNEYGYVDQEESGADDIDEIDIYFGKRDRTEITNTIFARFTFSPKMFFTLRARHYLSTANYKDFYELSESGNMMESDFGDVSDNEQSDYNVNFNSLNVDLVYSWQFAPGSFLTFSWKDSAIDRRDRVEKSYSRNLNDIMGSDHTNNFSVKITYFLDYLAIKKMVNKS
ncbi:DUF5916 domain-containing protein [Marinigracilibium pacificum]|uniref:Carbohydrate binding family 9 domain-containing protein n=1 Tax=Marinigracilibium pacificum TaxID=2729599 RepID=A0A848J1E3_9BACT|nr:DUF5916 domain-containing protein [Marinigracilibium pacificum]NMM49168.1 carbohydrate binding family 9 domain-containing protein [Marinigracilibium pacificum]